MKSTQNRGVGNDKINNSKLLDINQRPKVAIMIEMLACI